MTETRSKKVRGLLFAGLAILALLGLAAGLSRLELAPGQPFPLGNLERTLATFDDGSFLEPLLRYGYLLLELLLAAVVWVFLPILIVAAIVSPEARAFLVKRIPAMVLFLVLFFLLLRILNPPELDPSAWEEEAQPSQPQAFEAPQELFTPPDFITNPPLWLTMGAVLLLTALLFAGAALIWRRLKRKSEASTLTQGAQDALHDLQAGADLKDTVMRCYREMSQVVATERGVRRRAAMTPREFSRQLRALGWQAEHIERLTQLFERVRYGAMPSGEAESQEAVACLEAIVGAYGKPA